MLISGGAKKYSTVEMPMLKTCRLAILIPVYNESPEMFLRPLESLVLQEKVSFLDFEVIFTVNNSRAEAAEQAESFRRNQVILLVCKFLSSSAETFLPEEAEVHRRRLEKIKNSGLQVRVIDLSSLSFSQTPNTVGGARDFAGAVSCRRFLEQAAVGSAGILVPADCDFSFSKNYVSSIIESFSNHDLISLSGNLSLEADGGQNFSEEVLRATKLHLNWHLLSPPESTLSVYNHADREKLARLMTVNTAITVKAWMMAGGVPGMYSLEDLFFCQKVFSLPGKIAKSPDFGVMILNRTSSRAGALSLGRRVGLITQAVADYENGVKKKIYVPDPAAWFKLYVKLAEILNLKNTDSRLLHKTIVESGIVNWPGAMLEEFTVAAKLAVNKEEMGTYSAVDKLILEYLFNFLPQKDITSEYENNLQVLLDKV